MKSLLPLIFFCLLSTFVAVTHNRAVSQKQASPVTRPVMAALAPGQRVVSDARASLQSLVKRSAGPADMTEEELAISRSTPSAQMQG